MAPRGNKRAAPKAPAEEPNAKRVADFLQAHKVTKASFQPVVEVVEHPLAGLTEGTRSMILAALPWSIALPADQRHEAQQAVVRMVDETVQAVQAKLQEAVDSEVGTVEDLESSKSSLEGEAQKAEAAAEEAGKVVQAAKEELSEAEVTNTAKTSCLQEAETEEKRVAAELEQMRNTITNFEEVLNGSFTKLKEGSFDDGEAEGLVAKVMDVAKQSSLEDSLLATLPAPLAKRERGSFDQAVISEAEQGLRNKITALGEAATATEAQLTTCTSAAQAAREALEAATAATAEAASSLQQAQDASTSASAEAVQKRSAVTEFEATFAKATADLEKRRQDLDTFTSYNVSMFALLRDKATKPEESGDTAVESAEKDNVVGEVSPEEPVAKVSERASGEVAAAVAVLGA